VILYKYWQQIQMFTSRPRSKADAT